jgi:hypothetical protein
MTRSQAQRGSRPARFDLALAAAGASRGFTILILGGLSFPLAASFLPVVGSVWLTLTAVIAFIVAAWNAGRGRSAHLAGRAQRDLRVLARAPAGPDRQ